MLFPGKAERKHLNPESLSPLRNLILNPKFPGSLGDTIQLSVLDTLLLLPSYGWDFRSRTLQSIKEYLGVLRSRLRGHF